MCSASCHLASKLTVKVYRSGALAALGHNHVIISRELDGFVYLADDMSKARADLFVPVAGFIVDDAAERTAAGPDFATQPTLRTSKAPGQTCWGRSY